ncbi:MAG: ABC transporter permease [Acidobacteria bacterium]|nr:ABC transporter permease [Acidobacteriota bacterium]
MRFPDILRLRLRSLFAREQVEQELDEEMQYHLDRQIEANLAAGMDASAARSAALKEIGELEQRKEECRDARGWGFVENLVRDGRFALRQLHQNPGFATTAVLTLALGMCASAAIFAFVDATFWKPLPYEDPSRLVGVFESNPMFPRSNLSYPDYVDWKRMNKVLRSLDAYSGAGYLLRTNEGVESVGGASVSAGFLRTLGVTPVLGRDFRSDEDALGAAPTVLLSYSAWRTRYASSPDVIGQTVTLSDTPRTIIGVLPQNFHFAPVGRADFWTAMQPVGGCLERRSCHGIYGVGRLADGVSVEAAQANLESIASELETLYPKSNLDQGATILPLKEVLIGDIRPTLLMLLGGAGLLLLIGTVNVVGLLLIRFESRRREMAVRSALGASRGRLFRQWATEAMALSTAGGAIGLVAAYWMMHLLGGLLSEDALARLPFLNEVGFNGRILAFASAVWLTEGALFALAPSLRIWSPTVRQSLAEGGRGSAGLVWRRLGSKLVVVELATAMTLLVGAGLLGRSLTELLSVHLGIDPERLAMVDIAAPSARYGEQSQSLTLESELSRRLGALPGVRSVGFATRGAPLRSNGNTNWFRFVGRETNRDHEEAPVRAVSAGYFQTLGATLTRGRAFLESDDLSKPRVAIVNETFARTHFPDGEPLGAQIQYVSFDSPPMEIVGIVGDIREGPLDAPIPPVIYLPFRQDPDNYLAVVVRASQAEQGLLPAIAAAVRQFDPDIATRNAATMTDRIHDSSAAYVHRTSAWLLGGFAGVALLLGLIGVYGVIAYSVGQRRREIGVRMAMGARPGTVYQMVLGEAGKLAALGVAAGAACSVAAATLIRDLLFGVSAWDWPTIAAVAFGLSLCALAASYLPARRAASVDPVEALRMD